MPYLCPRCGQTHDGLPLDVAFAKPGAYFSLPPGGQRAKCELTSEVCVMARKRFFIRGCLPMPLPETGSVFVWGLWAEVSPQVFKRYQHFGQNDGTKERPSCGALSVEREPLLRGMDSLPVMIRFGATDQRPTFLLQPSNHWLCRDQQHGITLHRLQEILHALFPQHF